MYILTEYILQVDLCIPLEPYFLIAEYAVLPFLWNCRSRCLNLYMQVYPYKAAAFFSSQVKAVIPEQMYMTWFKNLEGVYSPQKLNLCSKISESPIKKGMILNTLLYPCSVTTLPYNWWKSMVWNYPQNCFNRLKVTPSIHIFFPIAN